MITESPTRQTFASLGVPTALLPVLRQLGAVEPFPIQEATLPDSLAGHNLLGRGRTGSGKTIAFAIPLVARLTESTRRSRPGSPRGLVLVPTRELANQVASTIEPLARAARLRVAVIYGGVGQRPQVEALRSADIVVACPGRLEDLVGQGHCRLGDVTITVLDEADHMSDMGFLPGVRRLLDRTPQDGQRMLFSATLDSQVSVLVDRYLPRHVVHTIVDDESVEDTMTHHVLHIDAEAKLAVVTRLAGGADRAVLFTRTKHGAKKLVRQLSAAGVPAVELHGNLSQNARERNLADFSSGAVTVLVATDIAARGIHVDDVRLVVHVDPPAEHKAFLHRSGRTARAGATGVVATVVMPDQRGEVRSMTRAAGIEPVITTGVGGSHPVLGELAGPMSAPITTPRVTARPTEAARPANRPVNRSASRGTSNQSPGGRSRRSPRGRSSR